MYTNHKRNEVGIPEQDGKNRPKVYVNEIDTKVKKNLLVNQTHQEINSFFEGFKDKFGWIVKSYDELFD